MRLNSIKLSGFKSFVDPTNLQVDGQLVGVVGPNGCGKSNIIDAVRWVLGESRASELRGESMRDVIFNGTSQRKPAGRASVELVFDNADGRAFGQWSRYAEIAVKRILGRDGNSTYFINNMPVRRRDIQDIFLGTGLGPRAYAIIGQGMISRIIEARPEELRIFLEEAAGVSKYKERRRETENRLQDTRENLTRVSDILRELNQNLEKLEAQAEVVMKYRGLQEDRDEKQKLLWLLHKQEARAEQTRLFTEIEQAQTALEGQIASLRKTETALEHLRQAHHAAGDKLHQAQGVLYQTNAEIGSLEAQIRYVIDSRARLQAQINNYQQQRDQWSQSESRHREEFDESGMRLEEAVMRVELARQRVEEHIAALPHLEQAWRDSQQQHAEARAAIMQVRQQIELSSMHHRNASGTLSDLAARRERLTQERGGLQAPGEHELAALKQDLEERQALLEEARMQLESLQERLPTLEAARMQARASLDQHATAQAQAEARLATLKQLQEKMQAESKVLPWLKKHELDSLPRLWQKLQVETGWETALESVLRERASALQLSKIDWARAFFSDLPPAKLALFSPASPDDGGASEQTAGLVPFHTLLKIRQPELVAVLREWLHDVFIAHDPVEALAERGKLPPGGHFVLPQGHLIGRSSVRFYATSSDQEGMLARQQEIETLTQDQHALYEKVREAKSVLVQAEAALSQCSREIHEAHQRINTQTQVMHGLQIQVVKLTELRDRARQRGAQIDTVLAEITQQEADCRRVMEQSENEFELLDARLAELQESEQGRLDELAARETQLAEARQRLRDAERAEQEAVFAEKALKTRIDELQRNIKTAREQAAQLEGSMQQGQLALQGLDDKIAQENLQSLIVRRFSQENELAELRRQMDEVAHQLRQAEEERMQAEFSLQPQRDKIVALQLKEQAARINVEHYDQQLTAAQADETTLAEKLKPGLKAPYLQGEVTRLSNAIEALGPVNLAAPGELDQAGERKRFLDSQYADLTEAIGTLEDAIRRIDRETRTLLADTFEQVNRNFGELFPTLFGGGQARLIMTGEEILDAGVQVMAQPPGKRNATIHLLSGGEKAMTAIALVFALFQLNPAPFCLMDEVDAPLDDANTERFCNMVRNMSGKTQFVFVSHNKIAMEMAQQLVGVTMQEQGVSRIVTVDIESAREFSSEVPIA